MSLHTDAVRRAFARGLRARDDGSVVDADGFPVQLGLRAAALKDRGRRYRHFNTPHRRNETGTVFVHKFDAFCWFGEAALAPGINVRHLDGDSLNNRRENLALGSQAENMLDREPGARRGHALKAAKARRKLTDDQARELVKLSLQGWTGRRLAAHYGLAKSQVSEILSGKLYSEATGLTQRPRSGACLEQLAEAAKGVA